MSTTPSPKKRAATATGPMAQIQELRKAATVEAAEQLLEISETADKSTAKAARRALYDLKLKGVEPAPHPVASAPVDIFKHEETVANRAWMTSFGGAGSRMLLFVRDDPHGGSPFMMTFLINNTAGISDLGGRKLSRRQIDEKIKELSSKEGTVLIEAPIDYARWVLTRAEQVNGSSRTPIPGGYGYWKRMVGEADRPFGRSPVYDAIDPEAVRNDLTISRNPETIFESQPFVGWMLDLEEIDPWEEKFFGSQQSMLVLDKTQVAERGERIIDEAADELMSRERILDYRTRLEETAYVLHLAGRHDQAKEALYNALGMNEELPAHSVPFARALVKRSIFVMIALKAEQEPDPEKEGLVARP